MAASSALSPVFQPVLRPRPVYSLVGLDRKNVAQDAALLGGELGLEFGRIHHCRTLFGRVFAQIAKSLPHHPLTVRREATKILERSAPLLPHLWREVLPRLDNMHPTLPRFRRHFVHLLQAVEHPLLGLWG